MVLVGRIHSKQFEQKHSIITSISQWRHQYIDRAETVIKVLAKSSFLNSLRNIYIGCSYDSDVSASRSITTNSNIFTRFQHTQKSCLSGHWQFSHFVQKQSTAIGCAKISIALTYCSCIRTFLMSKQLRINSSLGDATTVNGNITLVLSQTAIVYHTRYDFLTHTTFSLNEYTQVSLCHLNSSIKCQY